MAQVISPSVKRETALDALVKGMYLAKGVYDIQLDMDKLDAYRRKVEKDENIAQGRYDRGDIRTLTEKYNITDQKPEKFDYEGFDIQNKSPIYMTLRGTPIVREVKGLSSQGEPGTFVKDYSGGGSKLLDFIKGAPDPSKLTQIETVDADGKPITKFIFPKEGDEYLKFQKAAGSGSGSGGGGYGIKQNQWRAAGYARRMAAANSIMDELQRRGYDATSVWSYGDRWAPEAVKSKSFKQQEQAERNFLYAVLRPETGAAINKQEYSDYALQYFPRPGDSKEVLLNKRQNRIQALQNAVAEAGDAFNEVPQVTFDQLRDPFAENKNYFVDQIVNKEKEVSSSVKLPAPKQGDIVNGYQYIGPNPADPGSWVPVDGGQ